MGLLPKSKLSLFRHSDGFSEADHSEIFAILSKKEQISALADLILRFLKEDKNKEHKEG